MHLCTVLSLFFFVQAEDGIRDSSVTGVQTCALPICRCPRVQEIPGATGARTTVSEGLSTTARRGDRRRGLDFGPAASGSARETSIRPRPREPRGEGATMRDTQADVPSTRRPRAQLAFKDSMVHGILQFTPSIAFLSRFLRCESR